jgi:hypothetical protein
MSSYRESTARIERTAPRRSGVQRGNERKARSRLALMPESLSLRLRASKPVRLANRGSLGGERFVVEHCGSCEDDLYGNVFFEWAFEFDEA